MNQLSVLPSFNSQEEREEDVRPVHVLGPIVIQTTILIMRGNGKRADRMSPLFFSFGRHIEGRRRLDPFDLELVN